MANTVEICNLALSSLGSKSTIQSLEEASVEARQCKLHYNQARDTVLAASTWSFATKTDTSALLVSNPPGDWTYAYAEPADLVKMHRIVSEIGRIEPPLPYERGILNGQRVLFTDTWSPVWRYITNSGATGTYSPAFVNALVAQIAMRLAMPLTRKPDLRMAAAKDYAIAVREAIAVDANENSENGEPDYAPEWLVERGAVLRTYPEVL